MSRCHFLAPKVPAGSRVAQNMVRYRCGERKMVPFQKCPTLLDVSSARRAASTG